MRKKDILGNFIKKPKVACMYLLIKTNEKIESYSAIINFMPGCRELYVDNGEGKICLAGEGYTWIIYLPLHEFWSVTAFFSPENELIEWYFDISKKNFLDEDKIPCIDDLFLDLVVLPDGRTITIDADELQDAFQQNKITREDYNHAYKVHNQIVQSKWSDASFLLDKTKKLKTELSVFLTNSDKHKKGVLLYGSRNKIL